MNRFLNQIRHLPLFLGLGMVVFGTVSILKPQSTINIFSLFVGIVAIGMGSSELSAAFPSGISSPEYIPGIHRLRGAVNVVIGLVFLLNRTTSAIFAGAALGVWGVTFGSIRVHDALCRRAEGLHWRTFLTDGILRCIIGAVVLIGPLFGRAPWILTLGLFFIFLGISVIFSSLNPDRDTDSEKSDLH